MGNAFPKKHLNMNPDSGDGDFVTLLFFRLACLFLFLFGRFFLVMLSFDLR